VPGAAVVVGARNTESAPLKTRAETLTLDTEPPPVPEISFQVITTVPLNVDPSGLWMVSRIWVKVDCANAL
jgi:hypothetical protein